MFTNCSKFRNKSIKIVSSQFSCLNFNNKFSPSSKNPFSSHRNHRKVSSSLYEKRRNCERKKEGRGGSRMEGKRPRTCSSLRAIQGTRWNVYHVALKYLCSDRLYFVFDRRRGSRLPAILTVSIYREIYIYISELRCAYIPLL